MHHFAIIKDSDKTIISSRTSKEFSPEEVSSEAARIGEGCSAIEIEHEVKAGGNMANGYTPPVEVVKSIPEVEALKAIDPSQESGTLKVIVEFLQKGLI